MFTVFEQPDLKATFQFTVTAPAHWQVVSNEPTPEPSVDGEVARRRTSSPGGTSSRRRACPPTSRPSSRARTGSSASELTSVRRADDTRSACSAAQVARGAHGRGLRLRQDQARVSSSSRSTSTSRTRSRSTTSSSCRSTTCRCDGERGLRHVHRVVRVPLQGDRRRQGASRRDDPARAGAHVVRRPRDDALVGRPVAQRVVRGVGVDARDRRRPPSGPTRGRRSARWSKAWAYRQDQLPSTHPIVATINDLDDVRGQLRRHHVRQGRARCSSSSSRGWASSRS
jgi:hypothetical protein